MSFDAYAQWLKIPEDRRPPTHYDLLGLPPFEASIERIQASAMDRMGHVRRYQLGQHSDAAIQLLKEISLAYDTLITPARKAAYDRRLSGMETVEKVVGLETLVAEAAAPRATPVAAAPPPIQAPSGYVLAAVVEEPPPPIPGSPFKPGFEPAGPPAPPRRKRRSRPFRRIVNVLNTPITVRGAAKVSWRMTAFSAKAGFWSVRAVDRGMRRSLGEENTILHNFFRAVIVAVVLTALGTTPWWIPGVWAKWMPRAAEQAGIEAEPATAAGLVLEPTITPPLPAEATAAAPKPRILPEESTVIGSNAAGMPTAATPLYSAGPMTNSLGMSFVLVPADEFDMGSAVSRTRTEVQHRVRITRAFYLAIHEVTQAQFLSVMGNNPSQFTQQTRGQALVGVDTSRLPADSVTWPEAVDFCKRLSAQVQEQTAGRRYRLPTEAEWEYACRAGTKTDFHVGDQLQSLHANFKAPGLSDLSLRTMVVGSFAPNSLGLFDMHGNVEEWCSDYHEWGYYSMSPRDDPTGPASGSSRVARGGSYRDIADDCRSSRRAGRYPGPDSRVIVSGFRVVCEVSR